MLQILAVIFFLQPAEKFLKGRVVLAFVCKARLIERLEPPLIDQFAANLLDEKTYLLRRDARKFENWERYFAGQAAFGRAIEYAMDFGLPKIQQRIFKMADKLREGCRKFLN